jgi:pimeloyl-ACP methyl ester carboxylesterase
MEQGFECKRFNWKNTLIGRRFVLRKALKYIGIAVACLLVAVLSSALLYRKYLQHEVAEERAINSPYGINSLESVRIGGIDQWIEVRGQNVNNPILLFIHGGPGIAFTPLAGAWQASWERNFTVVQWDQRGAGKTYASNDKELQRITMNVHQMEQDTLDVVNYLRNRFKREKILVLGHSWGSVLGLWLAHEHPELIYAYVGVGQVINTEQNEEVGYKDALQEALKRHNEQAVKNLESIAPYPPPNLDFGKMSILRDWERDLLGPPPSAPVFTDTKKILSSVVSAPEYSLADDYGWIHSPQFSINILLPEMMTIDLSKLGIDFRAPVFLFEGRHDPYCPPSLIWDYYESIKAPHKEFIWFDNSGHFPFFEEQQKFANELVRRVLPLANNRSAND